MRLIDISIIILVLSVIVYLFFVIKYDWKRQGKKDMWEIEKIKEE